MSAIFRSLLILVFCPVLSAQTLSDESDLAANILSHRYDVLQNDLRSDAEIIVNQLSRDPLRPKLES